MTKPPRKRHKKPPKAAPYSRHLTGRLADQRTAEAKTFNEILAALTAWMGGEPDVAQQMMAAQVALLWLRCVMVADSVIDPKKLHQDGHHYLSWQANLRRGLESLGLRPMQAPPSIPTHLRPGLGVQGSEDAAEALGRKLVGIHERMAQGGMIPKLTVEQHEMVREFVKFGLAGDRSAFDTAREIIGEPAEQMSNMGITAWALAPHPDELTPGAEHPDTPTAGEAAPVMDVMPIEDAEPTEHETPAGGAEKPPRSTQIKTRTLAGPC